MKAGKLNYLLSQGWTLEEIAIFCDEIKKCVKETK